MPANRTLTNRLGGETSPYLRQHAEDPVDWFPWGEEAFAASRESDHPIFLSVGYASCHWCHVMHRESFADEATAGLLNDRFIAIKVDRESRPDIDELYMAYVTAATGRGGWPMSVFLTPRLVPVFGGTYFPPFSAWGMPSFPEVLDRIAAAFDGNPGEIAKISEESLGYLSAMFAPGEKADLSRGTLDDAAAQLIAATDPVTGGFGSAPKFPQAPVVDFLLDYGTRTGSDRALDAAEATMDGIIGGGIFDQAGGGIARYSVDATWLVPHFEKMLYDNGQLLSTLSRLHAVRPREEWAHAMRQTATFMDRELRRPSGTFASSLDADTDGHEGGTYLWTHDQLAAVLDAEELALAERHLSATPEGNWDGVNILTRRSGLSEDGLAVDAVLAKLLEVRQRRPQPALDEKVIVAWNALAARGLLAAGTALEDDLLFERGASLVSVLLENAVDEDGSVVRLLSDADEVGVHVLEDAAGLAVAALEAAEALAADDPCASDFVATADRVMRRALDTFYDGDGTWHMTAPDPQLPARPRETHDGPAPSGPALAAQAAIRLAKADLGERWAELAYSSLSRCATAIRRSPLAAGATLTSISELLNT